MAASQFDYAKMLTAQEELKEMGNKIAEYVLNISTEAGSVIDKCYTGEAADAYKNAFKTVADSVNVAVKDISEKLSVRLSEEHEDYKAKEQQMVESVGVPPLN